MTCLQARPHHQPFSTQASGRCSGSSPRAVTCRAQRSVVGSVHAAFSRRDLLGCSIAAPLLLQRPAWAEEAAAAVPVQDAAVPLVSSSSSSAAASGAKQVFLDVSVEGKSYGRIVIELSNDVKVGAARFADLAEGKEGVGYRLSKFDGIFSTYIRNEGVKSLSYNARGDSQIAGGDSVQSLEEELSSSSRQHDSAGLVSLVVREAQERPVKERLVAMGGKLVTLKEQAGEAPNGTSFMITTAAAPQLDKTNLVVGKVVSGYDVVEALSGLPFARPRDSYYDKPFFEAGKMLGDKRATVAEKRFNRPLVRVMVAQSGLL